MTGQIRVVQTSAGFVARCPIHGDLPNGAGERVFGSSLIASLVVVSHAVFVFHGEGAR